MGLMTWPRAASHPFTPATGDVCSRILNIHHQLLQAAGSGSEVRSQERSVIAT